MDGIKEKFEAEMMPRGMAMVKWDDKNSRYSPNNDKNPLHIDLAINANLSLQSFDAGYRSQEHNIRHICNLLEVAKCPACDGSGAYYNNYGEVEECQWCYERSKAMEFNKRS